MSLAGVFLGLLLRFTNPDPDLYCTALTVYSEARGESFIGQVAVAQTVLNRVHSKAWPSTACGVATQPHQFSGITFVATHPVQTYRSWDGDAWALAVSVTEWTRFGASPKGCAGATHFYARGANPSWAKAMKQVCVIDNHIFLKEHQ